jgi:hypothetical protein
MEIITMIRTLKTLEDVQDNPPDCAKAVATLFQWSLSFEYPQPDLLFFDIIGYSHEEYDAPRFDLDFCPERFGYHEIALLADALKEYAVNPTGVRQYIDELKAAEDREEKSAELIGG